MRERGVKTSLADGFCLVGLGLVGAGVWMIYPPAALIVVGAALFILGLIGSLPPTKIDHPQDKPRQ